MEPESGDTAAAAMNVLLPALSYLLAVSSADPEELGISTAGYLYLQSLIPGFLAKIMTDCKTLLQQALGRCFSPPLLLNTVTTAPSFGLCSGILRSRPSVDTAALMMKRLELGPVGAILPVVVSWIEHLVSAVGMTARSARFQL